MPNIRQTLILKRWNLRLRSLFDSDMLLDLSEQYDDELDESCARILNVVEVCEREDRCLLPEVAAGVIIGILSECACLKEFPDNEVLMALGYLLAKETKFGNCAACSCSDE